MERQPVTHYVRLLAAVSGDRLTTLLDETAEDPRVGVRAARQRALRRLERSAEEESRLATLTTLQASLHEQGFAVVAGVDEVGRGALAGPVTAAAVVLPLETHLIGLDDSKRLSRLARERIAAEVLDRAPSASIAHVPAHVIDALGIAVATRRAVEMAVASLEPLPDHVITDGHPFGLDRPETAVIKGDSSVASIAAASIIAKVARDALMADLAEHYPSWALEVNRGYGTKEHLDAIARHGVSPVHRRSFAPCASTPRLF